MYLVEMDGKVEEYRVNYYYGFTIKSRKMEMCI